MKDDITQAHEDGNDETQKVECHDRMDPLVRAYIRVVDPGELNEPATNLGDMLSDLMHWADIEGVDWGEALGRGERHYDAETDDPEEERGQVAVPTTAVCPECGRRFDLLDHQQAKEWFYGHDCEV